MDFRDQKEFESNYFLYNDLVQLYNSWWYWKNYPFLHECGLCENYLCLKYFLHKICWNEAETYEKVICKSSSFTVLLSIVRVLLQKDSENCFSLFRHSLLQSTLSALHDIITFSNSNCLFPDLFDKLENIVLGFIFFSREAKIRCFYSNFSNFCWAIMQDQSTRHQSWRKRHF